jgi:hypothetical protein
MAPRTFPERNNPERKNSKCKNPEKRKNPESGAKLGEGERD